MRPMNPAIILFLLVALLTLAPGCASEPEFEGKLVSEWVNVLRHDDWTVREHAQTTLSRIGKPAIPYMKRGLRGKDPTLRRGIVVTLGMMAETAREMIPWLLRQIAVEQVANIRAEILKSLAKIDAKASGVPEEFKKRLRDQDAEVQDAAKAGLAKLVAPKPEKAKKKVEKDRRKGLAQQKFALRDVLAELMKGTSFGIAAELEREDRRAAIVWQLGNTEKTAPKMMAFVFEKQREKWVADGEGFDMLDPDAAGKLALALGGSDKQQVIRPCGVSKEKLSSYLGTRAQAFSKASEEKKDAEAVLAYEELTHAFSFRTVAFSDLLPKMLAAGTLAGSPWSFEAVKDDKNSWQGKQAEGKITVKFELRPCNQGFVIANWQEKTAP